MTTLTQFVCQVKEVSADVNLAPEGIRAHEEDQGGAVSAGQITLESIAAHSAVWSENLAQMEQYGDVLWA